MNGGEVYGVGGCIRDRIYNKIHNCENKIKDFDLLLRNLETQNIIKLLEPFGYTKEVGKSFGVINFHHYELDMVFEIALPRIERSTGFKYKDFEIIADPFVSVETDLSRRDSTINSIAYKIFNLDDLLSLDIHESRILDPFDGISDIKKKVWKAVGDPYKRFTEDPTRILRAIRQCSNLELTLDHDTKQTIYDHPELLATLEDDSLSRLSTEIVKTIQGEYCSQWIKFIFDTGLGKVLNLNYDSNDVHNIVAGITRGNERKIHYVSKMGILLAPLEKNVDKWTTKYSLASASTFESKYIDALIQTVKLIPKLYEMLRDRKTKQLSKIEIRQLIQKMQKPQYDFSATKILLDCYYNYYDHGESLFDLYEEEKTIILNQHQLALSGGEILELIKDINGKEIGKIKQWLFNQITNGLVTNTTAELIDYLKKNYKLINFDSG
jgi:tRNA nucleotidyltransferase/poly(A) polymerase